MPIPCFVTRSCAVVVLFVLSCASTAFAAVTTAGNVSPAPPAGGGNVAGPFVVGDTSTGTVTVSGGTGLNVTGTSATIGNAVAGVGIMSLSGLLSDLATANDLTIGNLGVGRLTVTNLARVTLTDDLFVGLLGGSSGVLSIDTLGTVVDVNDTVTVSGAGSGVVEIGSGGRLLADDTIIGLSAGGDGRITVSGLQSLFQQSNSITIGDAGTGTLQVRSAARVENLSVVIGNATTGTGTAEVSGASSIWAVTGFMNIGVSGNAWVNILDGGKVTNTTSVRLTTTSAAEAHVTVSGANSLLAAGTTVSVGEFGFGTLSVLAGGRVTSSGVVLGDNTNSRGDATVDGSGSTWEITGNLDISEPGEATFTISNSGLVKVSSTTTVRAAGTLIMGGGRLESGSVTGTSIQGLLQGGGTVVGNFTNTATGEVRIGSGDKLSLSNTLANGGLVDVDHGEFEVGALVTNTGDIQIRGGVLRFHGGISNLGSSQLAVTGGDVDVYGTINNVVGAQIVIGGQTKTALHQALTNNGSLFITPGSELLLLESMGMGSSASFTDLLSSDDPVEGLGRVHVGGTATLGGTLLIGLDDGFSPSLGDTFTILTAAGGVTGTFSTIGLPLLGGGLVMGIVYTPNSVVLTVGAGIAGDYNQNGIVDAADYVVYRKTFGQVGSGLVADGNHNGQIDTGDLAVWRSNFGKTAGSGAGGGVGAGANVPEPAAAVMLTLLAIGVACARKRCLVD